MAKSSTKFSVNKALPDQELVDARFMRAAIRYSRRHSGITGTNPSVACLIVSKDENGRPWIAGRGVTAIGGRPHAEPVALAEAGSHAKGATAYVTLEPCAHHGVTAPCASTLIEAGIARVVSAQRDPDSRVDSKGFAMLREAGIEVVEGVETEQARWELRGYLSRKTRSRPWVFLKLAITADGYLGTRDNTQLKITGPLTNARTHMLRAQANAIMVGSGTVINDDPSLTCRLSGIEHRSPVRIALEHDKAIGTDANIVSTANTVETYITATQKNLPTTRKRLEQTACKILVCDADDKGLALPELLTDLADIGIAKLMVEGGATLATSMIEQDLVDEIILYIGSKSIIELLDDNSTKSPANWVRSPVTSEELPSGFRLQAESVSGKDRVLRFVRDN